MPPLCLPLATENECQSHVRRTFVDEDYLVRCLACIHNGGMTTWILHADHAHLRGSGQRPGRGARGRVALA